MGRAIITLGKGVGGGGGGNVTGPASSTDTALVRFSGTTGKIIQDSNVTLANSGTSLVFSGAAGLTATSGNVAITAGSGGVIVSTSMIDTKSVAFPGFPTGTGMLFGYDSGGDRAFITCYSGGAANKTLFVDATTTTFSGILAGSSALRMVGKTTLYNNISTAGWGAEIVQGYAEVTAQSAAGNIATYTVGAADGVFRVSADMSVTAATVLSTTLTVTYTDKANVARTMILPVQQLSGSFIAGGLITATGAWETPTMEIRCKASTAITILTSAGTFNTVVFSAAGTITQVG